MIFRQICSEKGGSLAYVLGDPVTREAVLIDVAENHLTAAEDFLRSRGLQLRLLLVTHWNASHEQAARALRERWGARLAAHESVHAPCVDMRTRDEDVLYFGEESLRIFHTPALTPCASIYAWNDRLFTGHTILVRGLHPKLHGQARVRLLARLCALLERFPEETLLYPGVENQGRRLSSIEEFRRRSQHGAGGDSADLLQRYRHLLPNKRAAKQREKARAEKNLHRYGPGQDVPASL
ncbi:MBL fold metallo-hydrolase [Acidithiobacillus sp. AMEEHan]|uniref:MBL fold metallo-hydrolase n=1 Tax=Acidithiobacillus sp. AMEEHan TaxID=2994951 RepID=UPI0027E50371|nr:MBL fold metallo-hydrolase [Acidithiobacillus sp. AMEEHan]